MLYELENDLKSLEKLVLAGKLCPCYYMELKCLSNILRKNDLELKKQDTNYLNPKSNTV